MNDKNGAVQKSQYHMQKLQGYRIIKTSEEYQKYKENKIFQNIYLCMLYMFIC